jgi:hypothetical protein
MPYDNEGNPRSGFGRASHANEAHASKKAGGGAAPKKKSGAAKADQGNDPKEKETPGGEEHMHAHSHKGGENDVSDMPMKDVVEAHGPATHMFSEHKEDEAGADDGMEGGGEHHVHTVHAGKHHHSDHDSAHAAHEHMGMAMGVGGGAEGEAPGEESPDEGAMAGTSKGIPGIV